MKERIYVCHTYYHVYIACLKELRLKREGDGGEAALVLSTLSNDFGTLPGRAGECPLFAEVHMYDEKDASFFPELLPLKEDTGSLFRNMLNRIRFCRRFAGAQAPFVPVDLRAYKDIYVFCDSDPVGYYLNMNGIPYHALEDGLDCIRYYDTARYDNRGHFGIKAWMAKLGLIHIQNGYSRYCIDMEVNDISVLPYPCPKYIEVPRRTLTEGLTDGDKDILIKLFIEDADALNAQLMLHTESPRVLLLSEPLCDLETRTEIFRTLYNDYGTVNGEEAVVLLKRHPRDLLDYTEVFAKEIGEGRVLILPGSFPMEVLNFLKGAAFARVVSVYTVVDSITFAGEKIYLGDDFMDRYEDPAIHRQNEQI